MRIQNSTRHTVYTLIKLLLEGSQIKLKVKKYHKSLIVCSSIWRGNHANIKYEALSQRKPFSFGI